MAVNPKPPPNPMDSTAGHMFPATVGKLARGGGPKGKDTKMMPKGGKSGRGASRGK